MRALAISIQRTDGTSFLATGHEAQCWTTFYNEYGWEEARAERDKCIEHGFRSRIVEVDIEITELPTTGRWFNPKPSKS